MTTTAIGQASGTISVPDESDWFKVSLSAGTQYVFTVNGGTLGSNAVLNAYDASGNLISSGSLINLEPTTSGNYFIGVTGSGGTTGTYQILESTGPYDYAGNTSTSGSLAIGSQVTGTLAVPGQSDWFKVTLTAGTAYNFTLNGASGAAVVTLYNSSGAYVLSGNDGNTLLGNAMTYVPTVSGTYYVAASDSQNNTGTFTLAAATTTQDFAGNVNTTGTLSIGGSATGNIANAGQNDWFKVTLTAGQAYVFNVTGSGLTPGVAVYNSTGAALASSYSGGANGGAQVVFEPTTSGTYFVGASAIASSTGSFTVSAATVTPDYLGNNLTSGVMNAGGSVTGNIATTGQSDWFKIGLNAGSAYLFNASGALSGANVTIYDSNGNALISSGGASTFFEPTSTALYYVGVSGSGTGAFALSSSTATVDHLGTTATNGLLSVGGASASGTLTNAGQSDWYKVTLTAGTNYLLTATGVTLSSPEVSLYSSTGSLLAAADGGGASGSSATSFQPTSSGTYYVGVSGQSNATGSFTVSVATATDDYAGNTSTTGVFSQVINAATAVADYAAHTLPSKTTIIDSAANIQSSLDSLASVVASGQVSAIQLSDISTPTVTVTTTQLANDAAVLRDITSTYTLAITGYSSVVSQFDVGENLRYVPGVNHAGSDQVIEISSVAAGASTIALGSGFNAVIVDGTHSATAAAAGQPDSFSFNVDANGTLSLLDNNTGHSVSITGDTYLIFNSAADSGSSYDSIYFIGGSTDGQIVSLYNAAFLRQPDLGGLEFYAAPINAGTLSMHQAAVYFLASPEFQADYPTASLAADHGGPNDQAYIYTLYENILNRAPSQAEINYYANALSTGVWDRAQILINFALSPENQADISNLLVNTSNGAYADSNYLLPVSTVLGEVTAGGALNTAAIDPSTVSTSGVTVNGITAAAGAITLTSSAPTETVFLSQKFSTITVQNSGSNVFDSSSNSTINLNGATNTTLTLGHGGSDVVNLLGGTNTQVIAFTAGGGTDLNIANTTSPNNIQILDGTSSKVNGASLSFGNGTSYVVLIGSVADSSAATAAIAANKAYTVADVNGNGTTLGTGEYVTFLAQDSSGNTQVWFWGSTNGATNGAIPASSLSAGADVNGNHLVDANELTHVATIVGVLPATLTANDLG
jgi:hypothetical protein